MAEAVAALVTEATGRGVSIHERSNEVVITGYAKNLSVAQTASDKLSVALRQFAAETQTPPLPAPILEPLPEEDWATAWQQYYHPLRIGQRLVIKPRWEQWPPADGQLPVYDDDIIIELDPQMAFGTGTHPTTQLCLEATEVLVQPGDMVADVGCGSGILSIAAAKLGARQVVAVDDDPVAAEIAAQNVRHNGVHGQVQVIIGNGLSAVTDRFDVIVANINATTIRSLAHEFVSHLLPGGDVALSGIIALEAENQRTTLTKAGLQVCAVETCQDWVCLIAKRSPC